MGRKTKLIPFDYMKWRRGLKAVNGNKNIEIVNILEREDKEYPFLMVYKDKGTNHHSSEIITKDGRAHPDESFNHIAGLLEEVAEEKTFYANVYGDGIFGYYKTLDDARYHAISNNLLGHLKISYADEDLIK